MTTEFLGVPTTWTALDVRKHVSIVGSAKETVYRIALWQWLGLYDYGAHHWLVGLAVGVSLVGVVIYFSVALMILGI